MVNHGTWCARCHHMIAPLNRGYGHVDNADWSGIRAGVNFTECPCVNTLTPCEPPKLNPVAALDYQWAKWKGGLRADRVIVDEVTSLKESS